MTSFPTSKVHAFLYTILRIICRPNKASFSYYSGVSQKGKKFAPIMPSKERSGLCGNHQ